VGRVLKKLVAAILAVCACSLVAAQAADLPVKAKALPPPEPTWWVSGGGLIWGVKGTPLPPTLTTFAPGSPSATTGFGGDLGVAGTNVLSPGSMNAGPFGGGEFTVGRWLSDPRWGVEFGGFFLASRSAGFGFTSDGTTPLRIPFNNVPPGAGFPIGNSSFILADPAANASGGQAINTSLRLWGIEGNVLHREISSGPLKVSLLAGVRYIDLREGLSIVSNENLLTAPGGTFFANDNFATKNQFIGAQIGVKAREQFGQFDASGVAKIALGDNYQTVAINGSATAVGSFVTVFGAGPAAAGGFFAQSTNSGQFSRNQFAVAPQVELEGGYRLQNGVRLFVGYDFLYINNVVRPGNQIDTTVNTTSNAVITPPGTLVGAARPAPLINGSSFWAQGVKLGASYAF
jgi:hypothetical protein